MIGRTVALLFFLVLHTIRTEGQPCSCDYTIQPQQLAVNANDLNIQPGDTVCIQAGNRDYLYLANFHGDSLHPVVFINCGGVVTVQNNYYFYGIKIAGSTNFRFTGTGVDTIQYGIRILGTAPNSNGLSLDEKSSDFEIDHLEIAHTGFAGIMAKTNPVCDLSANRGVFTMRRPRLHDNYIHHTGGEGFYIGHSSYNGYATTCNGQPATLYPHDITGLRIYNNIFDSTAWDGIQVGCATEDCEIYNNRVTNYGWAGVVAQNSGIQIGGGTTGKCYNNYVHTGTGNGIAVFGTGNNLVYNNVIADIGLTFFPADPTKRSHGIFCDDRSTVPGRYFRFVNNTIVNVKTDGIRFSSLLSAGNRMVNNIIVHPGSLGSYSSPATSYINLYGGASAELLTNLTLPHAGMVMFRDSTGANFRLLPSSPARDSGSNVSSMGITDDHDAFPRPYGTGFDAGAFEYHPQNRWKGCLSPSWQSGENWSQSGQPNAADDAEIPAGTLHLPFLDDPGAACHHLTIEPGGALEIGTSGSLTINGNLVLQGGSLFQNQGTVTIKGDLQNQNNQQ